MSTAPTPEIPPALLALVEKIAKRPLIPTDVDNNTLHIGANDLPWAEAGDGSAIQLYMWILIVGSG